MEYVDYHLHGYSVYKYKICAVYRDMLPRPTLVCQEPGQILISLLHTFFICLYSSVGLVANFAGLPSCTVPSAVVHCNQNEAGHQTIKAPRMLSWGASWIKHFLAFMPQHGWNCQIKSMKSVSMGSFQYKSQVNGECFAYLWVILLFHLRI